MVFTIDHIPKMSFNVFSRLHWTKQKKFKDTIKLLTRAATRLRLEGGYDIHYTFFFTGRKLDTINVVHYCKTIEDTLFKQDNDNGTMCIDVQKGKANKVIVELNKINNGNKKEKYKKLFYQEDC